MQATGHEQKKPDYFGILKKSWQITRENKSLWWFGLLAALGGGGINFSFPFGGSDFSEKSDDNSIAPEEIVDFLSQYAGWIIFGLIALACVIIFFSILRLFGRIGLIESIDLIEKNKNHSLRGGIQAGKKFFWKIFWLNFLIGIFMGGITLVLFYPVGYLFYLKALPAAFLSLLLALVIWMTMMTLAALLRMYSALYIVLGKISLREAIENAYMVFNKNIAASISMFLVILGSKIVFNIIQLITLMVITLPFIFLGVLLFTAFENTGAVIAVILGSMVLIPGAFLISSIRETFCQAAWSLFFREIAEIKAAENVEEVPSEIIGEKIPGTEAV